MCSLEFSEIWNTACFGIESNTGLNILNSIYFRTWRIDWGFSCRWVSWICHETSLGIASRKLQKLDMEEMCERGVKSLSNADHSETIVISAEMEVVVTWL